jgi:hypothetical protein
MSSSLNHLRTRGSVRTAGRLHNRKRNFVKNCLSRHPPWLKGIYFIVLTRDQVILFRRPPDHGQASTGHVGLDHLCGIDDTIKLLFCHEAEL